MYRPVIEYGQQDVEIIVSGPTIINNIIESTLSRVCVPHTVRSYNLDVFHRRQIRHPTIVLVLDNSWLYPMAGRYM